MPNLFLVMFGGAVGAGFRYQLSRAVLHLLGPAFPWGTWIVNLLGGLLMGVLAGALLLRESGMNEPLRLLVGTGVLGGFTTFSAFSLESANMLQRGDYGLAGAYMISSVAGSILMLFLGLWCVRVAA